MDASTHDTTTFAALLRPSTSDDGAHEAGRPLTFEKRPTRSGGRTEPPSPT